MRSIKDLKPSKHSRYKQGYFDIRHSQKYEGSGPVIYRSSFEKRVFQLAETSTTVIKWSSEPLHIKILYRFRGKTKRYNIDVYLTKSDSTQFLIEIKPFNQTVD